ncbi:MAG: A24 family peptidase [Lachnospiraceae bacterium]|nr:A24 family peptidase [Lachnospiraceae bacterium]
MVIFLNVMIYLIVFLMGIVVFSYLNYVIERLPNKQKIFTRRSNCKFCGHEQKWVDVFPIISRMLFQNRCRYCGKKMQIRPLLVELLGGTIACLDVFFYGVSIESLFVFIVACDLALITFIDIDTQEIPPQFNYALLCLGIVSYFILDGPGLKERIIGLFVVSVPMLILALFNGFGGGDVKLMFASGFLLGWKGNVAACLIGIVSGSIYAVICLVTKKKGRKDQFAFGPFLSAGIYIALIMNFGAQLVQRYIDYIHSIRIH